MLKKMKKHFTLALLLLGTIGMPLLYAQKLAFKWKTDTLLRCPESVLLDPKTNTLYAANINGKSDGKDGNGFVSQLTTDGKIKKLEWATGLDAPKGMGLVKNTLYVADLTRVVAIDVTTGKISQTFDIEGAQFLNDVTTDEKGNVYISDSSTGKIHRISNGKAEVYFESKDFTRPNGLLALKEGLYIADFGTGTLYKLTWDKQLSKVGDAAQGADGIVELDKDTFIVSSWHGEIYTLTKKGVAQKILDTKDQKLNSADIWYDGKAKTLFIPTFFGNSVSAYSLSK
jgi:hypothetical protein